MADVVRRENVVIHRDNIVAMLRSMNEMSFNGGINCDRIQDFLFENVQTEDFEFYNPDTNMMLVVSFVPAENDQPRHVYLEVFLGAVNGEMSEEEIDSKRLSRVIVVPRRFYIMTKYKGNIAYCELIDSYDAENYLPFKSCWPLLADA